MVKIFSIDLFYDIRWIEKSVADKRMNLDPTSRGKILQVIKTLRTNYTISQIL